VAGIPVAGIPVAGIPVAGIPVAGIPVAGIPVAGTRYISRTRYKPIHPHRQLLAASGNQVKTSSAQKVVATS